MIIPSNRRSSCLSLPLHSMSFTQPSFFKHHRLPLSSPDLQPFGESADSWQGLTWTHKTFWIWFLLKAPVLFRPLPPFHPCATHHKFKPQPIIFLKCGPLNMCCLVWNRHPFPHIPRCSPLLPATSCSCRIWLLSPQEAFSYFLSPQQVPLPRASVPHCLLPA